MELDKIMEKLQQDHGMTEPNAQDIRRRIAEMLEKITSEKLLNRIYRFVKYIYIHREVQP